MAEPSGSPLEIIVARPFNLVGPGLSPSCRWGTSPGRLPPRLGANSEPSGAARWTLGATSWMCGMLCAPMSRWRSGVGRRDL
jgi:hypothetical protein